MSKKLVKTKNSLILFLKKIDNLIYEIGDKVL